ncbi:MAG TPA: 3,4-dihydroxy-2-butanone-4-phosphate synthase [Dongiaceae bacterium]
MKLDTIKDAIAAMSRGELVIVVDDTDRENEGDLIMAAGAAAPEKMAFMIRHTSGIICVPMTAERAQHLHLDPMVANNLDPMRTAFTVSVDYRIGMTTGISAEERSGTARALANDNCGASDFLRPGHVFPLIARAGGVLTRSGHTEAATDLARLAGFEPVGVLAEVVNDDGTVKRLPQLLTFAAEHKLKIISIEDLIQYRMETEQLLERIGPRELSIGAMKAAAYAFQSPFEPLQHVVAVFGDLNEGRDIPCRIHREQPVIDMLRRAEHQSTWFENAIGHFKREGRGILIVIRSPAADELLHVASEPAASTPAAGERHNSARSRMQRWRDIGIGAQILKSLGVKSIALLAPQEQRYIGLAGFGIEISRTIMVED